ncbi:unnamed protein product, partial [Medioppia subpectinata]
CGICGSDLHLWTEGHVSDFILTKPCILGHESSATVLAVGESVQNVKPGDRVAVEPAIPCLECDICRAGRYNLCLFSNLRTRGLPPMDGCLTQYYTHPSRFCYKLANHISSEEGAMCEPLSVVIHAVRRIQLSVGHNVLVCGAGTIGLMSLLCAKAFGANKVYITDVCNSRLELAKKLGADQTYLIDSKLFNDTEMAKIIVNDMGDAPDVTLECTGVASSTCMAIYATKDGGKVGIIGLGDNTIELPMAYAAIHEIDLIGICRYKDDFQLALQLISSGKVDLKPLVSHRFPIEEAINAFKLMKSRSDGVL